MRISNTNDCLIGIKNIQSSNKADNSGADTRYVEKKC